MSRTFLSNWRERSVLWLTSLLAAVLLLPGAAGAATLSATPSLFAGAVSSAQAGDTVLLASGSYGTWSGTNKAITIKADAGASPTMRLDLGNGDANFTLDGIGGMGGAIVTSNPQYGNTTVHDITIKNSDFTGTLTIDGPANANILLNHNVHHNINLPSNCAGTPAMIHLAYGNDQWNSGVTVQNSVFRDGNADGIQTGVGLNIINNEFVRLREKSSGDCAHTDPMQIISAKGTLVRGNWVHDSADGIVAYDGLDHNIWEDNVVSDLDREGFEIYSDNGSIIRHNTGAHDGCGNCGELLLSHKSADPVSTGTQAYDNVVYRMAIDTGNGPGDAWARNDHNVASASAQFVGGTAPSSYAGFALAGSSPVGRGAGSDGLDAGIRTGSAPPPPPPPPPADTTPPDTTIATGPSDPTTSTSASFAFRSSESGSTFACKLDAGAYASCTSPKAYSALSIGSHTFTVRATDAAGNVDATPATQTWSIGAAPPPPTDYQPVAAYVYSPTAPSVGRAVTFDASSATCPDDPCTYTWADDGPDGPGGTQWALGNGETMSFTFHGAGTKWVRLTVTDAAGDNDSSMKAITIAP